jgi:hypothetical protein
MMNFVLGTVAGGLIACVVTIAAARHPEVQHRLGLVQPAVPLTLAAGRPPEPDCRQAAAGPSVGTQDMLFNRRRFWSVAP